MKLLLSGIAILGAAVLTAAQTRPLEPMLVVRLADSTSAGVSMEREDQQPPGSLSPLPVTRLDLSGASATLDAVRPLTLRFSQPAPLRDVLMLLIRETGLSLSTEPGLEGTFIGELNGVTLRQALNLVLHPQSLDYGIEGSAIRVFRRRPETRIFDVNVATATRRGSGGATFSSALAGDGRTANHAQVGWTADVDGFGEIARGLQSMISPDGRFAVDRKAGVVQVTDYADRLDRIAVYLESIERRLRRQVEIVARVVEVTLNDPTAPAVDWTAAVEKAQTTNARGVDILDFAAFVKALGEQGTVVVLASPRLTTLHSEPAVVRVGIQDVTFEREGEAERATAMLDGFALAVTPHISADGDVTITVSPTVTQRTGEVRSRGKQKVPVLAVDEVNTAVRLHDGETLVLPGLRRAREQRGASTGGLRAMFKREEPRKTSSEMAVLLTPKVL